MSNALLKTSRNHADDPLQVAAELAQRLATTANARDQAGGHAEQERELICASGLLTLSIPTAYGGQGADWPTVYQVIRILARADSALAHVFGSSGSVGSDWLTISAWHEQSQSALIGVVPTRHPVDYKIRDLGRYALDGTLPEPTAYS